MPNITLISSDLSKHPSCPHGPALLFSRLENATRRNFFACSACRDRKDCAFFIWQDEYNKFTQKDQNLWNEKAKKLSASVKNHISIFKSYNDVKNMIVSERVYCATCEEFQPKKYISKHEGHDIKQGIADNELEFPTHFLKPLDNSRKEAQYFFSNKTIDTFVEILTKLDYVNILCIGAPRIHEKIRRDCPQMNTLLLDFDKRYHNFFGPLEFCWYNFFNHYFFKSEAKKICKDFIRSTGKIVLVTDPPFGGRIEPLADSIHKLNSLYIRKSKNIKNDMDMFWFFPYFMEGQIKNSFPKMEMMDYKVDYDNHPLFNSQKETSKAKFGSPVRIFTNVDLSEIVLPAEEGYKFCKRCNKYVSSENRHCKVCRACTSKDGRRYRHCAKCQRCVKPAWQHCPTCNRCALKEHVCGDILFLKDCFHCNEPGHKKQECPKLVKPARRTSIDKISVKKVLINNTKHKMDQDEKDAKHVMHSNKKLKRFKD